MWIHSIFLRFCGRAHRARSSAKPVAALRVDKPVPLLTSAFCTPYSSLITSKLLWQELSYAKVLLQRCEPELSLHSVCVCVQIGDAPIPSASELTIQATLFLEFLRCAMKSNIQLENQQKQTLFSRIPPSDAKS